MDRGVPMGARAVAVPEGRRFRGSALLSRLLEPGERNPSPVGRFLVRSPAFGFLLLRGGVCHPAGRGPLEREPWKGDRERVGNAQLPPGSRSRSRFPDPRSADRGGLPLVPDPGERLPDPEARGDLPVSYTHLTLPTI